MCFNFAEESALLNLCPNDFSKVIALLLNISDIMTRVKLIFFLNLLLSVILIYKKPSFEEFSYSASSSTSFGFAVRKIKEISFLKLLDLTGKYRLTFHAILSNYNYRIN